MAWDQPLRVLGWDHERCMAPLRLAARLWQGATVACTTRPLQAFNDQPVSDVAREYDLIAVDHPLIGAATDALAPLDGLLDAGTLDALAATALGTCHRSYHYQGRQWAVAIDAACHVSAVRDDLVAGPVPATWPDVLGLARARPQRVAVPLYPADAICALLTLCANAGAPVSESSLGRAMPGAVAFLAALAPMLHPASFTASPPELLERMRASDEIVYAPLLFGYRSYADPPLRFTAIPSAGLGPVGAVLGGVGLAVSAYSRRQRRAADFAAWLALPPQQRDIVLAAGGQPASRTVWDDRAMGAFFNGTRATLEAASVRPRDPWWPGFQEAAGRTLATGLRERTAPESLVDRLERLFRDHRPSAREQR